VLVSHLHYDHFDPRSLRMLDRSAALVLPRGTGRAGRRLGFSNVIELAAGETVTVAGLEVSATHADHGRGRLPGGRVRPIGFTIAGDQRVYFAGDTDLFDGMQALGRLDLALLPVSGWGPRLGPGHLDPEHAAEALARLKPRVAVPIHWGTIYRIGLRRVREKPVDEPPHALARAAALRAPAVDVRVLRPAESTVIDPG
jgi:L-ascorbate metabolism protein UlaG (beta-lactamase superfamily)